MNTNTNIKKTSASHVSKALRDECIQRSQVYQGKIVSESSRGFVAIGTGSGAVCVKWVMGGYRAHCAEARERQLEIRRHEMLKIKNILINKGYNVEEITERTWDGNPSATFGFFNAGEFRVTKK